VQPCSFKGPSRNPPPFAGVPQAQVRGLCSNYLCDRRVGDELVMTGPSGTAMLLPRTHMEDDIVCISTGAGAAGWAASAVAAGRAVGRAAPGAMKAGDEGWPQASNSGARLVAKRLRRAVRRALPCLPPLPGTGIAPFRSFWRRLFYDSVPGHPDGYQGRFWLLSGFANSDSILYGAPVGRGGGGARGGRHVPFSRAWRACKICRLSGDCMRQVAPPLLSLGCHANRSSTPSPTHQSTALLGDELRAMESAYPEHFRLDMALSLERKNKQGGLEYVQVGWGGGRGGLQVC
jgi:hypothetical protein